MNDLDNKLKALELDRNELVSVSWGYVKLSDEGVEQVKQVFIDAGWRAPSKMELMYQDVVDMQKAELTRLKMSANPPDMSGYRDATLDATKKAAGIDHD
jgi:hypothetical protein